MSSCRRVSCIMTRQHMASTTYRCWWWCWLPLGLMENIGECQYCILTHVEIPTCHPIHEWVKNSVQTGMYHCCSNPCWPVVTLLNHDFLVLYPVLSLWWLNQQHVCWGVNVEPSYLWNLAHPFDSKNWIRKGTRKTSRNVPWDPIKSGPSLAYTINPY